MIEFYYWPTPTGHKIAMFLEETGLDYTIRPVNISAGDQFKPEFLAFSPNNRMPAIIDDAPADHGDAVTLFESGRNPPLPRGKDRRFLPGDLRGRKFESSWKWMAMSRSQLTGGATDSSSRSSRSEFRVPGMVAQGAKRERRLGSGRKVSLCDGVNERERRRRAIGLALLEIAGLAPSGWSHARSKAQPSVVLPQRRRGQPPPSRQPKSLLFARHRSLGESPDRAHPSSGCPALYRITDVDERSLGDHQQTRICLRVLESEGR